MIYFSAPSSATVSVTASSSFGQRSLVQSTTQDNSTHKHANETENIRSSTRMYKNNIHFILYQVLCNCRNNYLLKIRNIPFSATVSDQTESINDEVKNEAEPVYNMFHANYQSFGNILPNVTDSASNMDVPDSINDASNLGLAEDDDCLIIGSNVPVPLQSTSEGLTKREDDSISKDMPFITTVSILIHAYSPRYSLNSMCVCNCCLDILVDIK